MAKYTYPAVFALEENGQYSVTFPDLKECYTCGDNLQDAIEMAEDALTFCLFDYEKEHRPIPATSDITDIKTSNGEFVNYIVCDTIGYQRRHNNKAVKKTLTIPVWLDEAGKSAGVNYSKLLQNAIIKELKL